MQIIEFCRCDKCSKSYKGRFYMQINGQVTCVDCDDPEVYVGLQFTEVHYEKKNALLYEQLSQMLLKDLMQLYPLFEEKHEAILESVEQNGAIDLNIVYFMYNPFQLVRAFQETAYLASYYILQEQEGQEVSAVLVQEARKIIEHYFTLRERQLTGAEIADYWAVITSEQIQKMKAVLEL